VANWIINKLTMTGDIDLIQKICKMHFVITPHDGDPDKLERIVEFPDVKFDSKSYVFLDEKNMAFINEHCNSGEHPFGFRLLFGLTSDEAHGGMPGPRWQGEYGSLFYMEWCSKWAPTFSVVTGLAEQYPSISFEYLWYDLNGDIWGQNIWQHGEMIMEEYDFDFYDMSDPDDDPEADIRHLDEYDDAGFGILNDDGTTTEII
jgi:hypothetical protein